MRNLRCHGAGSRRLWTALHWKAATAIVLSSAVALSGCCCQSSKQPPPQTASLSPQLCESTGSIDSIRASLFSIYYVALRERHALPSPDQERYPPCDVITAANTLGAAPDAVSWKRRAIAVLVGSMTPGPTPDDWTPEEYRKALSALGAPFAAIANAWNALQKDNVDPRAKSQKDESMALEATAWNVMNTIGSNLPPKCCACLSQYHLESPVGGGVAMASFQFNVERPPADVRTGIDPRCWAKCEPTFFTATYPVSDCSGNFTSPIGSSPNCGNETLANTVLLENVQYAAVPGLCLPPKIEFRNLLQVDAAPLTGNGYTMNYAFCHGIDSSICGAQSGLSVDCGCTGDSDNGLGDTVLHGVKYIRFCDPALDDWTVVGLHAMIDEIGEEGVCCGMTGPAGTCQTCNPAPDIPNPNIECAGCAATSTQPCP